MSGFARIIILALSAIFSLAIFFSLVVMGVDMGEEGIGYYALMAVISVFLTAPMWLFSVLPERFTKSRTMLRYLNIVAIILLLSSINIDISSQEFIKYKETSGVAMWRYIASVLCIFCIYILLPKGKAIKDESCT